MLLRLRENSKLPPECSASGRACDAVPEGPELRVLYDPAHVGTKLRCVGCLVDGGC
jgi:hypothetical protein